MNSRDDGSRLIRADEINNSCLFHRDSPAGHLILKVCRLGYPCVVAGRVNSDVSDVAFVVKVYSVNGGQ